MWKNHDDQIKDEILKNCFTAYIASAVQHRRIDYIKQLERRQEINGHMEKIYYPESFDLEGAALKDLPFTMKMENEALMQVFLQLEERERYVLLKRIIDETSLDDLANELGLSYKGVAAVYYRAVKKIRKRMRGE